MYKVIVPFRDKYIPGKVYQVGDSFTSDDENRITNLLNRKLIEGVSNDTPSIDVAEHNAYQLMTKKEIKALLTKKGIKFNDRQTKAELIAMLGGE